MDTIILAASLISFVALVGSWLALPHSSSVAQPVAHTSLDSALVA